MLISKEYKLSYK